MSAPSHFALRPLLRQLDTMPVPAPETPASASQRSEAVNGADSPPDAPAGFPMCVRGAVTWQHHKFSLEGNTVCSRCGAKLPKMEAM